MIANLEASSKSIHKYKFSYSQTGIEFSYRKIKKNLTLENLLIKNIKIKKINNFLVPTTGSNI